MSQKKTHPLTGVTPRAPTNTKSRRMTKKKTVGLSFKLDDILEQLSHSEGHEFNINDPSTINEEEAELIATMRAADVDGDGTISLMELSKMGSSLTKANRMAKHYKKVRAKINGTYRVKSHIYIRFNFLMELSKMVSYPVDNL